MVPETWHKKPYLLHTPQISTNPTNLPGAWFRRGGKVIKVVIPVEGNGRLLGGGEIVRVPSGFHILKFLTNSDVNLVNCTPNNHLVLINVQAANFVCSQYILAELLITHKQNKPAIIYNVSLIKYGIN